MHAEAGRHGQPGAVAACATVTRALGEKLFGYSRVSGDLDGHTWEVAWVGNWI